ncbi:phosphoribosylformylglycinamidine (FGAM) synthase, PurS subunit [mine drainage metagenome]|uniref:Phosphoribosylformylglycinamidine (FGAM) synthase, PurS subunit n=1 Tax=mine drainage metagenome TaxID=410659 RepID=T0YAI1_9ZZZZ
MASQRNVRIEVRVELKPGVADAEAETVERSLGLLGIDGLARVTTARIYGLEFSGIEAVEARRQAEVAVDRLLANPIVHRVTVSIVGPAPASSEAR